MTKTADKPAARKPRARKKKPAEDSLEHIFELIDERVESRGQHERGMIEDTEVIVNLVEAALKRGATMPELARRVKRYDRTRGMVRITRQALDAMLRRTGPDTRRRDARTEESRRRAEEMHAFYMRGHSARETGEHFGGISDATVLSLFHRHGLEVRPRSWRPRQIARGHLNIEALS